MIWNDGVSWHINKYEVTEIVHTYSDSQEGFSENATFREVVLTEEQQARFDEIKEIQMNELDAIIYVRDGIWSLPDNRTNEQKLVEKLIELDPTLIKDEMVLSTMINWEDYKSRPIDRYVYVIFENKVYQLIHPKHSFNEATPEEDTVTYVFIGSLTEEGKVTVEEWSQEKCNAWFYTIGKRAYYQGKLYEVVLGNGAGINTWRPDEYGWKVVEE